MSEVKTEPVMHVLKTSNCKSTSGKSTLTYQIGCQPDDAIYIRITRNSNTGFCNSNWVSIKDILKALSESPNGQPLTSFMLQPLIEGRSSNTPGFVMAALTHEKMLRVLKGKKRGHEFLDPEDFTAKMDKLVSAKAKPKAATSSTRKKAVVKKALIKKAAVKKKSMSRRKTPKAG